MRVYLAGPIYQCADSECKDWREQAKQLLPIEWETVDPMARDYRGREDDFASELVGQDLLDIRRCHYMLVNAMAPSWGTAMEIRQAYLWILPVFAIAPVKHSPWLKYHCRMVGQTLETVIASMLRK